MSEVKNLACFYTLLFVLTGCVRADLHFLDRNEGESVVFSCVVEKRNPPPYGVYLQRRFLQTSEVLFMYTKSDFSTNNSYDKNRTSVSGDPSSYALNVTITQLRVSDTDRYVCEFLVPVPSSEDLHLKGNDEFVLVVKATECGCSGYSTLLYALSAAVAVLLLLVFLIGCVVFHRGKARRSVKSHPQVPIYEEMAGVHADSQKLAPYHLEETSSSENKIGHMKRSCPENHYERPSGCPRRVSP
uniref:Uncharacterized LOC109994140 n=1 Tax=Labrus bergylta TaxID=56723 RepID=A0A3Q3EXP6_9LABR